MPPPATAEDVIASSTSRTAASATYKRGTKDQRRCAAASRAGEGSHELSAGSGRRSRSAKSATRRLSVGMSTLQPHLGERLAQSRADRSRAHAQRRRNLLVPKAEIETSDHDGALSLGEIPQEAADLDSVERGIQLVAYLGDLTQALLAASSAVRLAQCHPI